jgi:4-hydroxybenzoate polyprenyltransferase
MDSDEIVSARTALRYLARGDSTAKRAWLGVILLAFIFLACALAAFAAAVVLLGVEAL